MFWMRNKENSFPVRTLIWRPVIKHKTVLLLHNFHRTGSQPQEFLLGRCMRGSRKGGGGGRGSGSPIEKIGFLNNTGPDRLKNHKATKPAFNDRLSIVCFAGGPMMVYSGIWILPPHHQLKKQKKKKKKTTSNLDAL